MNRSHPLLALRGWRDLQRGAVFGDGSASAGDAELAEVSRERGIGEGAALILCVNGAS